MEQTFTGSLRPAKMIMVVDVTKDIADQRWNWNPTPRPPRFAASRMYFVEAWHGKQMHRKQQQLTKPSVNCPGATSCSNGMSKSRASHRSVKSMGLCSVLQSLKYLHRNIYVLVQKRMQLHRPEHPHQRTMPVTAACLSSRLKKSAWSASTFSSCLVLWKGSS